MSTALDKFFLKSTTVIGIIVGFLPTILPIFGISFNVEDGAMLTGTWDAIIQAIGGVMAIVGRVKAVGSISFNPFK